MKRSILSLIVLAALATAAWAAEPVVSIDGPAESLPGDLVVLRAVAPEGAAVVWLIRPAEAAPRFVVVENGRVAIFASRTAGRYEFILAASIDNQPHVATHTLANDEPTPPPPPPPPPVPPEPNPYTPPPAELQAAVAPVTAALAASRDQENASANFRRVAGVFSRTSAIVVAGGVDDVAGIRRTIVEQGKAEFGDTILGHYPAASPAIEAVLKTRIGLANLQLSAESRAEAGATLSAIAWAAWEASR